MDPIALLHEQINAHKEGKNFAVVTIVSADGSTPRSSGKMIVYADGSISGTIGGGRMERMAVDDAVAAIKAGSNAFKEYNLTAEGNTAMICGGEMSVMIEVTQAKPLLVMCGAGHVGKSLITLARRVGFEVLLVDNRAEELIMDKIERADRFVPVKNFEEDMMKMDIPNGAYIVIATFGHKHDADALAAALRLDAAYIGMIGSKGKVSSNFDKMRKMGFTDEQIGKVYSPIGLDLGGETPDEIAVSVVAEIQAVRYGRPGGHMSLMEKHANK